MILPPFNCENKTQLRDLFDAQRRQTVFLKESSAGERVAKLKKIQAYLLANRTVLAKALYADSRKPATETDLTEVYGTINELNVAIRHLKRWMKPQPVPTPLGMLGTTSYIQYEPKGVTLIISPWNYPIYLTLKPLISAIAAGNTAFIKPSEQSPGASAFLRVLVQQLFPPEEVAVLEGDATLAQYLLELPFDHIFFTGSSEVGKGVMTAAARNLTSVTLELGGKSPVIIDETAEIRTAARQIAWGKWINNGQTCVAPDFILIQRSEKDRFIREIREAIRVMYDAEGKGIQASESYARIINDRHFQRLRFLLDDAVQKGATVSIGGQTDAGERLMEPTLLENVTVKMAVMQEEIFGPLLPVIPYDTREEVVRFLGGRPKPLVLYIFSGKESNRQFWLNRTTAGNTVLNDTIIHFANAELPVGGVKQSGIGKSNGFYGFQEFSNARGVVKRQFGNLKLLYPPYSDRVKRMVKIILKYF